MTAGAGAVVALGSKLDGVLRSHQINRHPQADGSLRDTCVYSIIAAEWPTVRAHLDSGLSTGPHERARPARLTAAKLVPVSQDELGDIRRRLRAVEQDAAAARVLAGAADRDVTEIRAEIRDFRNATTASFNSLRQDFVDLRQDFVDLGSHVDRRFEKVDRGFAEMRGKLDATAAGQQRIVGLIESLIEQQNR